VYAAEVRTVLGVRGEVVEELTGIDHRGPTTRVEPFKNARSLGQMHGVLPDVGVLASTLHVCNTAPLTGLSRFRHSEERCITLHFLTLRDKLEHPDSPKLVNEFYGNVLLFHCHRRVGGDSFGRLAQKIHRTTFSELLPVFRGELPPQDLEPHYTAIG
jgi:hypothetical protein